MSDVHKHFLKLCVSFLILIVCQCESSPKTCVLDLEDHIYDLGSLAERDYWRYEEKDRYGNFSVNFYLSICHPLRNLPNEDHCTATGAGQSAVCLQKLKSNKTLKYQDRFLEVLSPNAGVIKTDSLTASHDGWLEYSYGEGMECEVNGKKSKYTTIINLLCPPEGTEESPGPVLMSNLQCQLVFAWLTKTACPVIKERRVTSCMDTFNNSSEILNLHALHSSSFYNVTASNKYEVNICGPIEEGSCDGTGVTVCDVTDPNAPKVVSKMASVSVMWHGPLFTLHYNHNTSGTLPKNEKEVVIQFLCDRSAHETVMQYVSSNATFVNFVAMTNVVCTPKEQNCVIKDTKDNVYDLRPLHLTSGNWEVLDHRSDHRVS